MSGEKLPEEKLDRSTWAKGPWDSEPDHVEFRTKAGYHGMANRNAMGNWCGYVAVEPGHPLHGMDMGEIWEAAELNVHGGVTYAEACQGEICHVPPPGEPDNVWWIGFDCGHACDVSPYMQGIHDRAIAAGEFRYDIGAMADKLGLTEDHPMREKYRDLAYVQAEIEDLAAQLKALEPVYNDHAKA
jgi:hypothetical protein